MGIRTLGLNSAIKCQDARILGTNFALGTYPYCIGFWFKYHGTNAWTQADQRWIAVFHLSTNISQHFHSFATNTAGVILYQAGGGGTANSVSLTPPEDISLGSWFYFFFRATSGTTRRFGVMSGKTGLITWIVGTTSRITQVDTFSLGRNVSGETTNGSLYTFAEFVAINGDVPITDSTTATDVEPFIRALAYRGPFSIPELKGKILSYRSFKHDAIGDQPPAVSERNLTWTSNLVQPNEHPPLHPDYVYPQSPAFAGMI